MPKISIITPIYNSEKYLEQCLESIISQTLTDIEIILIDDGSTDSSPEICDKYAKQDNRINVIHKENAGMGVSYNIGMDIAQGEYIGFIESDDFADKHMFEDLYNLAQKHNPDIVKSAWFSYWTNGNYFEKDYQIVNFNSYQKFNIKDYSWLLLKQFSVWSAIYRTDFIRNKNIRYLETPGASYQDVAFTYKAFCLSDSMVITPNAYVYYRRDNENSSVNSKEKSEVIFGEYEEVDRFFSEHPEIKEWANTNKLQKQYFDYKWNYNRIAEELKPNFLTHFASDFRKYQETGNLTEDFYSSINPQEFDWFMSAM